MKRLHWRLAAKGVGTPGTTLEPSVTSVALLASRRSRVPTSTKLNDPHDVRPAECRGDE